MQQIDLLTKPQENNQPVYRSPKNYKTKNTLHKTADTIANNILDIGDSINKSSLKDSNKSVSTSISKSGIKDTINTTQNKNLISNTPNNPIIITKETPEYKRVSAAVEMLKRGKSIEEVMDSTYLTKHQIKKLKKDIL